MIDATLLNMLKPTAGQSCVVTFLAVFRLKRDRERDNIGLEFNGPVNTIIVESESLPDYTFLGRLLP